MTRQKVNRWLEADNLLILEAWARDGLIDDQIAKNIGIARATLYNWRQKHPQIEEALKRGKEVVDIEVENALLKNALGFEYEEETTEMVIVNGEAKKLKKITKKYKSPDTTAQIIWLKNRRPDKWRDRREITADVTEQVNVDESSKEFLKYLKGLPDEP